MQWNVLPITHSQVLLGGNTSQSVPTITSSQHILHRCWRPKPVILLARSLLPVSCDPVELLPLTWFGTESGGVDDIKAQVSSSHYMNTSLTAPDWNADCHLVPNLCSAIVVLKCIKLILDFKFRSSYLYAISNFRGKSHPADSAVYMWSRNWELLTTCRWRWWWLQLL